MGSMAEQQGRALQADFERILGGHGATARLARALGRHQSHLHRIWSGKRPIPDELVVVRELLDALPRDAWPERWTA